MSRQILRPDTCCLGLFSRSWQLGPSWPPLGPSLASFHVKDTKPFPEKLFFLFFLGGLESSSVPFTARARELPRAPKRRFLEEPVVAWPGPVPLLQGGRWCEGQAVEPLVRREAGS